MQHERNVIRDTRGGLTGTPQSQTHLTGAMPARSEIVGMFWTLLGFRIIFFPPPKSYLKSSVEGGGGDRGFLNELHHSTNLSSVSAGLKPAGASVSAVVHELSGKSTCFLTFPLTHLPSFYSSLQLGCHEQRGLTFDPYWPVASPLTHSLPLLVTQSCFCWCQQIVGLVWANQGAVCPVPGPWISNCFHPSC